MAYLRSCIALLGVLLVVAASPVMAQEGVSGVDPSLFQLTELVVGENSALIQALRSKSDYFVSNGAAQSLLSIILVMMILSGLLSRFMGAALDEVIAAGIQGAVLLSVPFMAIMNWPLVNSMFYDGMLNIAKLFGSLDVVAKAANLFTSAPTASEIFKGVGMLEFIPAVIYWALMALVMGVASLYLIMAMFIAVQLPMIFMAIGMVFGPLLIVWMAFRPMSGFATTWISFMVANAMTLMVASLLMWAAEGVVTKVFEVSRSLLTSGDMAATLATPFIGVIALAVIMFVIGHILLQSNNIARGLTGGVAIGGGAMERGAAMISNSVNKTLMKTAGVGAAAGALGGGAKLAAAVGGKITQNAAATAGVVAEKMAGKIPGIDSARAANIGEKAMSWADKLGQAGRSAPNAAENAVKTMMGAGSTVGKGQSLIQPKGMENNSLKGGGGSRGGGGGSNDDL